MTQCSPAVVAGTAVKTPAGPRPALPFEYTHEWDRADPRVPGEARRDAQAVLAAWGAAAVADDVALVVSELVTNAVVHGAAPVTLLLRLDSRPAGTSLSGEVRDAGAAQPARIPQEPAGLAEGGRGLALVAALTAQLGTARRDGANAIWFRLPVPCGRPTGEESTV